MPIPVVLRRRSAPLLLFVALVTGVLVLGTSRPAAAASGLTVTPVVGGLDHPWDVTFAPDGTLFVTERRGRIVVRTTAGTVQTLNVDLSDLWASGETGLMGIEVDPDFMTNRRLYTCQGTVDGDFTVQVVAWQVNPQYTSASRVADPLVGGIDGSSGRHGGCQLRFDTTGALLVGTGDAAVAANPQSLDSLAGKVLRVDRFTGQGVPGNPFVAQGGNRARIFTYGHRNVQGLAVQPGSGQIWEVEHGSFRDDEVNRLTPGGNYGWDPNPPYDESPPMTDLVQFPSAVPAAWSSGPTTIATSGAAFLRGAGWGSYEGMLAVSVLKDQHLRLLQFDGAGRHVGTVIPPELNRTYGRLRGAEVGPGGLLFVTTDNGGNGDAVLAIAPPGEVFGLGIAAGQSGTLDAVTRGADDQVWTRQWNGSAFTAWASLGGQATTDPDIAWSGGDVVNVVTRGNDGAVWIRARSGGQWTTWQSLGGVATSGPTVTSAGPGRLEVYVRGSDGALWVRAYNNGWGAWQSLGGGLVGDPDAASVAGDGSIVAVRGVDDALWVRRRSGGSWAAWEKVGGILSSSPGVAATGGRVDVFVRGRDDKLWQTASGGGGWTAWGLGAGLLTSAPDASWRGGLLDTVERGRDGAAYQIFWTGSSWSVSRWG